jgi:hypothetical protein
VPGGEPETFEPRGYIIEGARGDVTEDELVGDPRTTVL